MTKETIRTKLDDSDWMDELDGMTVGEAIGWLTGFPATAELDTDWGWDDSKCGEIYSVREETDVERMLRLAQEDKQRQQELLKKEAEERLRQERIEEKLERLKLENMALQVYLSKHKDNPNVGDLENLFTAVMQLERAGHGAKTVEGLKEAMERLEKEGGTA